MLLPGATATADTAHAGHGGGNLFVTLLHHVQDAPTLDTPFGAIHLPHFTPFTVAGISFDMSITKHVVFLWIAALILCVFGISSPGATPGGMCRTAGETWRSSSSCSSGTRSSSPIWGRGAIAYMPYLLTTFFYILLMNLLGLIPYGASATGNVNVTAGLAIIAFVMIQAAAIRAQGLGHYLAHLTGGVHWALWPIMIPIEILGLFTKPFALCIRLFANMTGGHIVLVSLIGLIFVFQSYIIAVAPVGFVVGINFLELFVAFLQAYIFMMLTSLFMGLGMQAEGHGPAKSHGH